MLIPLKYYLCNNYLLKESKIVSKMITTINIIVVIVVYMCIHAIVCTWRSEDSFLECFLPPLGTLWIEPSFSGLVESAFIC